MIPDHRTTGFASRMRPFLFTLLLAFWSTAAATGADSPPASRIPLLYCTDLFHPHDDPDDHFDLATLYAIPEFESVNVAIGDDGVVRAHGGWTENTCDTGLLVQGDVVTNHFSPRRRHTRQRDL